MKEKRNASERKEKVPSTIYVSFLVVRKKKITQVGRLIQGGIKIQSLSSYPVARFDT